MLRNKEIMKNNNQLLEKFYRIYTREGPQEKGLTEDGKPVLSPKYSKPSLNIRIRSEAVKQINYWNLKIVDKLAKVKPKVITAVQCELDSQKLDKKQLYMHDYKNFRKYSTSKVSFRDTIDHTSKEYRENVIRKQNKWLSA